MLNKLRNLGLVVPLLLLVSLSLVPASIDHRLSVINPAITQSANPFSSQQTFSTPFVLGSVSPSASTLPSWTNGTPIPTPREGYGAAEVNGIFYYIAGFGPTGDNTANQAYNPANDTWTTGTPLPSALADAYTVLLNGKIYVFGGFTTTATASTTTYIYDITSDVWTSGAPAPAGLVDPAA